MYRAKIVSKGDQIYHATTSASRFEMGSDGVHSNPVDTLLASLCACLGHYVGDFLHQEKLTFSEYSISAEAELTKDHSRLADIHVAIQIEGAVWEEATTAALLNFVKQCCIHNTLKANSQVFIKVTTG